MKLGRRGIGRRVFAPLLCAWAGGVANAEAIPCETPLVFVDTDDQELHERVCGVVALAIPILERCQLKLTEPVTISFSDGLGSPNEVCLGLYHQGKAKVELLRPEAFEKAQVKSRSWKEIPIDEHYDSIIVHELAHAHVGQVAPAGPACSADWEYIAYAMQIASLSASTRDDFIAGTGVSPPISVEELNPLMLGLSPSSFAARSWLHFSDPENECEFVGQVIRGERTLMMLPE